MPSSQVLVGVALAVPDPWGRALDERRASYGDAAAGAIPAHVTLLPPTTLARERLPLVEEHLARTAGGVQPFEIELRGTATFRPASPVVFVALARGGDACDALQAALRTGPLARGLDHPYHPHVTVAHDLPDDVLDRASAELAGFCATFQVDGLVLYQHDGRRWEPRRTFALGSR